MTGREKRIREALEAVPLPHDWEVCQKPANEHWYAGRTIGAADPTDARRIADTCALSAHAEKFATYIAACNPTAIRTLLADLDAVRGALKQCHSTLTDERLGQWHYMEGSQIYSDFKQAADRAIAALTAAEAGGWVAVPGAVYEDDGVSLIRRGTEDERCRTRGSVRLYAHLPTPPKEQSAGGLGLVDAVAHPRSATE